MIARQLHSVLEPYHGLLYFAPEVKAEFGLGDDFWGPYFGSRVAPLGMVSAPVVTATFYHFRPEMIEQAFPSLWQRITPQEALRARLAGVDAALRRVLGEVIDSTELVEAAELATAAAAACQPPARVLGAANAALPIPDEPHLALWQAATTLREFRGDGHVVALAQAGLDGVEAIVSITAVGGEVRSSIQARRGWSDEQWIAAERRLTERGWLDASGEVTEQGRVNRQAVEDLTDTLAMEPWHALGADTERLYELLLPITTRVVEVGGLPKALLPQSG